MPRPDRPIVLSSLKLGCALVVVGVLAGCARNASNVEQGNRDQELYIGIGTDPEALDPHLVTGATEHYVLLSLFEGLVTNNAETLVIEPGVAESWDVSPDGLRYTFHFDPDARWSNGDPVTAQDFLFSFERILSPSLGAPYAYMLHSVRNAEQFNNGEITDFSEVGFSAPDASTLVVKLLAPTPYFLSLLTHYTWWPVHPPTILEHGKMTDRVSKWTKAGNLVSNGPFALESWRLNRALTVGRNPRYRGAEAVALNRIHFLPIEIDAEERAFRTGNLHLTSTVPIPRIDWYRENRPESIRFDDYLGVYYYLVNTSTGPLADKRVRKALAYAIDRDELVEHVLKAGQKPAYHFTPPNTGGYLSEARLPYDPELARKLLAEAGYPDGEGFPGFEVLFNTSESHRTVALAIQQMWKNELGIDVDLYNQEWKVYLSTRQNGEFDVARAAWIGDYDDPNTFLSLGGSKNGNNHSGWSNPEFDEYLATAAASADPEERKAAFQAAEAILLEEMPFIPIYFYVRSLLIDPAVRGWHPNILDYHPYQAVRLEP